MSAVKFWMSPFRTRIKKFAITNDEGKETGVTVDVPYFVADVATSRKERRQSIEIEIPVAVANRLTPKAKKEKVAEAVSKALERFDIHLSPAQLVGSGAKQ